jgi:hypothetical protein
VEKNKKMNIYIWDIIRYFKEDHRINFSKFAQEVEIQRRILYTYVDGESKPDYMREKGLITHLKENYDLPCEIISSFEEGGEKKPLLEKSMVYEVIKKGIENDKKRIASDKMANFKSGLIVTFPAHKPDQKSDGKKRSSVKKDDRHNFIYKSKINKFELKICKVENKTSEYKIEVTSIDPDITFKNKKITIINDANTIEMPYEESNTVSYTVNKSEINIDEEFRVFIEDI